MLYFAVYTRRTGDFPVVKCYELLRLALSPLTPTRVSEKRKYFICVPKKGYGHFRRAYGNTEEIMTGANILDATTRMTVDGFLHSVLEMARGLEM